jgi:hypothetical protein
LRCLPRSTSPRLFFAIQPAWWVIRPISFAASGSGFRTRTRVVDGEIIFRPARGVKQRIGFFFLEAKWDGARSGMWLESRSAAHALFNDQPNGESNVTLCGAPGKSHFRRKTYFDAHEECSDERRKEKFRTIPKYEKIRQKRTRKSSSGPDRAESS